MNWFAFNATKTTQAAAHLLKRHNGKMSKYILLKLLYLADRSSLQSRNCPITGDEPYSMELGPVPSHALDFTNGAIRKSEFWDKFVATPNKSTVVLKGDPGRDELSDTEIGILNEINAKFGKFSFSQMKDYCHSLPEYDKTVGKSSRPISLPVLLKSLGKTDQQIRSIAEEEFESLRFRTAFGI